MSLSHVCSWLWTMREAGLWVFLDSRASGSWSSLPRWLCSFSAGCLAAYRPTGASDRQVIPLMRPADRRPEHVRTSDRPLRTPSLPTSSRGLRPCKAVVPSLTARPEQVRPTDRTGSTDRPTDPTDRPTEQVRPTDRTSPTGRPTDLGLATDRSAEVRPTDRTGPTDGRTEATDRPTEQDRPTDSNRSDRPTEQVRPTDRPIWAQGSGVRVRPTDRAEQVRPTDRAGPTDRPTELTERPTERTGPTDRPTDPNRSV